MKQRVRLHATLATLALALVIATTAGATGSKLSFTNIPLLVPSGSSEPAITIGLDGRTFVSALNAGPTLDDFQTLIWGGTFGSTPAFQGAIDSHVGKNGRGGDDADVDLGSTGTLHVATLVVFFSPNLNSYQLGIDAITCPNGDTSGSFAHCTTQVLDTAGTDRPWITSDGRHVYVAYHDARASTHIVVQRSDDDGYTWRKVGDPILGQGTTTSVATYNNFLGPIVADPSTHEVFEIYVAGDGGLQKAKNTLWNRVYVARSTDLGATWNSVLVYRAPYGTDFAHVFPSLALDPVTGKLYGVWADGHHVFLSISQDLASTWSAQPFAINVAPAVTATFPWVAAYRGTVDVVYYGTTSTSTDDDSAVWFPYATQTKNDGASFVQAAVSARPNHVGVICNAGSTCPSGSRRLADLFEDAIDPRTGLMAVAYVSDQLTTTSTGDPQPQTVVAFQR
jgi:hypothetical protein